jgi:outer membrane protein OmpA-like peptidoglycan-associated protein
MNHPIRATSLAIVLLLTLIAASGCATRKYVSRQIGNVELKVAEVGDVQAQQGERIDAVDRRAKTALMAATGAGALAETANARALAAGERAMDADRRADAAQQTARRALNRLDTMEGQIEDRFANLDKYTLVDKESVTFKFDSDLLTPDMLGRLDGVVDQVFGVEGGYTIELQGFTDSIGSEKYNLALSERRAVSVLRYLVSQNVPLHRISIVGLGTINPAADNKTSEGRELNRRVELRVLVSGMPVAAATVQ